MLAIKTLFDKGLIKHWGLSNENAYGTTIPSNYSHPALILALPLTPTPTRTRTRTPRQASRCSA